MFIESQSADPTVHRICMEIAQRCLGVIEPLLRQEERREALTEFYRAARSVVEKPPSQAEEV